MTSTRHDGNLGGIAGADAVCQQRAMDGGLPGTFVAFLRTDAQDPIDRLNGSRGWVRPDGAPVYDTVADIEAERQWFPIELDERGVQHVDVVLTGSGPSGRQRIGTPGNCTGWTVNAGPDSISVGRSSATSGGAFTFGSSNCQVLGRLYCFEVGHAEAVGAPPAASGRIQFVSSGTWTGGSLASADAICSAEATAASLPGTYRALLATAGTSPASRFSNLDGPWRRADGMRLTTGTLALPLEVAPNRGANGDPSVSSDFTNVWLGAATLTTSGTTMSSCASFTATSGPGAMGLVDDRLQYALDGTLQGTCGTALSLHCLQE